MQMIRDIMCPFEKEPERGSLPKKVLMLVVQKDEVRKVITTLTDINRSDRHGDGKIFVCPITDGIRIRTSEHGSKALS